MSYRLRTAGGASKKSRVLAGLMAGSALAFIPGAAFAQESESDSAVSTGNDDNQIIVTGIRSSLQSALNQKRAAEEGRIPVVCYRSRD